MSTQLKDELFSNDARHAVVLANEKRRGIGGDKSRALNAVTIAITGALGGQTDLQTVSNALAPYAAQVIGQKFGHGEDKNTTAQMVSHAILGATLAYVNGGNPAAGGTAAVASEAAANYFAKQYDDGQTAIDPVTGQFNPNLLPEGVKSSIRDLTTAIGAVVGGTVGDSAFNAQLSGVVGQNTVENNALITESPDGKSRHYTPEDNKFNLLQYLVATGQLTLDQVPDSIFEDMANRGYTSLTDGDKAPNNSSEEEKYRQNFIEGIKDEQIISEQKFLELMNKNPEMWAEVKEAIETKQFWEGVKEPVFKYVLPGLQLGGGVVQTIGAGAIDVVGCATIVACGVAVGGSSFLVINGLDDIRTGWNNFGGLPEGQTASSTLTSLGVSEGTAGWVKLGAGGVSIGAEATIINKGLSTTISPVTTIEKAGANKTSDLMESVTAAGDTVHHSPLNTAVGDDKATLNNFKNATDTGNGHNVIVHGQLKYDEIGGIPVINGKQTNMEQVAEAVRSNPDYVKGTPVCLGSCWSGTSGTAQELANSLNVPVMAPTRPTAWDSKAKRWIMDTDVPNRKLESPEIKPEWKMFYPEKEN